MSSWEQLVFWDKMPWQWQEKPSLIKKPSLPLVLAFHPDIPGLKEAGFYTNETIFSLTELPPD
jgi:hypothetical protein